HVAFFCGHPAVFIRCLELFRRVEPERPIVCVFEDIDAIIKYYGDSDLLQWLDGNHQVDQAGNLASTHYPEDLDRRIISPPRPAASSPGRGASTASCASTLPTPGSARRISLANCRN